MSPRAELKNPFEVAASTKRGRLRSLVRVICLVVAIAAIWPVLPGSNSLIFIPALSPFVAITSLLSIRAFHFMTWLGLTVGVVVLVRHRFFCRWICPVGLCMDGASTLGKRMGRRSIRIPQLGRWIVWLTIGGSLLGYPFLLWFDPLSIFSNVPFMLSLSSQPETWLPVVISFTVFILSMIFPQMWCQKICPLGAFQDISFRISRFLNSMIFRKSERENTSNVDFRIARRAVLGITTGAVCAYIARPGKAKTSHSLRPPGALNESHFAGLCTRCGNCLRVCPSSIIERDFGQNGWVNLFTPVLGFDNDYCREDCVRCNEVCPSGALVRLSLKEKTDIQIGLPEVNMNICLLGDDRECSECKRWCPYDAIRYVFSEEQYTLIPKIDPHKCNGCGACEAACPTKPNKAIVVLPDNMLQ